MISMLCKLNRTFALPRSGSMNIRSQSATVSLNLPNQSWRACRRCVKGPVVGTTSVANTVSGGRVGGFERLDAPPICYDDLC